MEQQKDFTGVWIPKQILENNELSLLEKMLYAEIACFESCFVSNEYLGRQYGVTKEHISRSINKLINLGFVVKVSFDGRKRVIRAKHIDSLMQSKQKDSTSVNKNVKAGLTKMFNINNNLNNNLNNLNKIGDKHQVSKNKTSKDVHFEEVKKLYYQYLKNNQIPIMNHNTLRSKIKEMYKIYGYEWCYNYLNFMIKNYNSIDDKYKPMINNALDVYTKSKSIENMMTKMVKQDEVY